MSKPISKGIKFLVLFFVLVVILFHFPKQEGCFYVDRTPCKYKLPYLVKFAAVVEREEYYKTWLNNVIIPDLKDTVSHTQRVVGVFNWINNWVKGYQDIMTTGIVKNVVQHEYYTLIKQYDERVEKVKTFCNLMAVLGYPASQIYDGVDWKAVVKTPEGFLYFDFITGETGADNVLKQITDKEGCEEELSALDTLAKKFYHKKYLWGDLNVSRYAFWYYFQRACLQKPGHVRFLIK